MLAHECLEEFKVECDLRRLGFRTVKGYYNNAMFLNYLEQTGNLTALERIKHLHIRRYMQFTSWTMHFFHGLDIAIAIGHTDKRSPSNKGIP